MTNEDTRPCPNCSQPVRFDATRCSHCWARFDAVDKAAASTIADVIVPSEMSEFKPQPKPQPLRSARHRYRDAYRLARAITGIGSLIKGVAIGQTLVIAFATLLLAIQFNRATAVSVLGVGLVFACIVGIASYLFGLVVAAQGQILKASVDGAVHSSPFLSLEEKADEMSL